MTFQTAWLYDDTDAFDELCTVETGTVLSPVVHANLPCTHVIPTDEQQDVTFQVMLTDATHAYDIGCRVVYDAQRYVITRIQRDGDYVKLMTTDWPETV